MKFVVIDVETGGLDERRHSILEFAAVIWEDGAIKTSGRWLIREKYITAVPEALEVNKISISAVLRDGLDPAICVGKFEELLDHFYPPDERIHLAGWNVHFDERFLKRLYEKAGIQYRRFDYHLLDLTAVALFFQTIAKFQFESFGLDSVLEQFKIPIMAGARHTALGDADATARLLTKFVELSK